MSLHTGTEQSAMDGGRGGGECEKGGNRRIKLFCPSVSKIIQIIAADEQRLDLGSIARAFGLDPTTVKLNGHFISRGVDLIASSVTWKSLIGFFSSRGLSTGATDSDALVVDGKLSKIGCKRSHGIEDAGNWVLNMGGKGCSRDNKRLQCEHSRFLNNEKVISCNSGQVDMTQHNTFRLKRKQCLDDRRDRKRTKFKEDVLGWQDRKCNALKSISCSFLSRTMKRVRGECYKMVAASAVKRSKILEAP
ncbi:uncharacterized protein LOC127253910 isoform X2 [Andrographis paniculata]|uniref:uncharacterized protein LOC127253910 isoform X2 n=1 Tax=Andrographis paniculata TaxID=175694 RepID=UPI0021E87660|nr:uncharacterized protein LOC127253910 isoform X2 [Andrographis paniculata]